MLADIVSNNGNLLLNFTQRSDGSLDLVVHNNGVIAAGGTYLRTVPQFAAPDGPHAWLNEAVFVGSVSSSSQPDTVVIRVFRLL